MESVQRREHPKTSSPPWLGGDLTAGLPAAARAPDRDEGGWTSGGSSNNQETRVSSGDAAEAQDDRIWGFLDGSRLAHSLHSDHDASDHLGQVGRKVEVRVLAAHNTQRPTSQRRGGA